MTDNHVDYPHNPGTLWDCEGCEDGDCVCIPNGSGCVSRDCVYDTIPFELSEDVYAEELEEEYGHA